MTLHGPSVVPELMAMQAAGMKPLEVLKSATTTNAALLNRAGELGTVRAGALADLLVVRGNPVRNLKLLQGQGRHLALIMKDGRIYKNELA